ncbi:MAG TPA: YtxH domain-containing protein [Candidatus Saccharimonadales bacterium]|nr:YtxH domain-containing protein [Candidatus Saccharimonadales bacterium]
MTNSKASPAGVAFLAGISAGALAALLFAPKSGQETRRQLKDAATNARRKAQETMQEQQDKASKAIDKAAATTSDSVQK